MSKSDAKDERKKVALDIETYDVLKAFSRQKGLKLRHLMAAMADVVLANEELSSRVVDLAIVKSINVPEADV